MREQFLVRGGNERDVLDDGNNVVPALSLDVLTRARATPPTMKSVTKTSGSVALVDWRATPANPIRRTLPLICRIGMADVGLPCVTWGPHAFAFWEWPDPEN